MTLFIDGDAFPNQLKVIIFRAINRLKLRTYVVSNKKIDIGQSDLINHILVESGADEADHRIVEMVEGDDLVITSDIPLADRVIKKNACAINHRGDLYDEDSIKQSLAMRNLMTEIRETGGFSGGPAPLSQKDAHKFANQLDRFFTQRNIK